MELPIKLIIQVIKGLNDDHLIEIIPGMLKYPPGL